MSSSDDILSINLIIAQRQIPLKIRRGEEEIVRLAAREFNKQIIHYRQQYEIDDINSLIMAALPFIIDKIKLDRKRDTTHVTEELDNINSDIVKFLKDSSI